ncbi:hypothetical protein V2G26_021432 [Clonostachys chloroleuca]
MSLTTLAYGLPLPESSLGNELWGILRAQRERNLRNLHLSKRLFRPDKTSLARNAYLYHDSFTIFILSERAMQVKQYPAAGKNASMDSELQTD